MSTLSRLLVLVLRTALGVLNWLASLLSLLALALSFINAALQDRQTSIEAAVLRLQQGIERISNTVRQWGADARLGAGLLRTYGQSLGQEWLSALKESEADSTAPPMRYGSAALQVLTHQLQLGWGWLTVWSDTQVGSSGGDTITPQATTGHPSPDLPGVNAAASQCKDK